MLIQEVHPYNKVNPKSEFRNQRSLGTASAEEQDGKHANKRAPAANSSLSAASRCASRPPSDPSV
ncbi:MAG TPA: hypothetical protein VHQ64_15105 [Pyrinomonadaceae bacterium]|nr:hypothetical protein [Pyrinomonadaceae bacterium]